MKNVNDLILKASQAENAGDYEEMYAVICEGLSIDCCNYELYYMLGFYYLRDNIDRAFLCFRNALFFCMDKNDRQEIIKAIEEVKSSGVKVKDTVIVIVSYNNEYLMQKCIESIRLTTAPKYIHTIVVDNASDDGVREWLESQRDIILVKNSENVGFSVACNQGVRKAKDQGWDDCDIFLLNNDTRLPENALFNLKMALYADPLVGAVGAVANYAGNNQQIEKDFDMPADYVRFGETINIPDDNLLEERVRLSGFAMLVRSGIYSSVGGMDEAFAPGYFEDDDLCIKIEKAGYKLVLANNAYIYHAGSQSFAGRNDVEEILLSHHKLFIEKYGFDILEFGNAKEKITDDIEKLDMDEFNLLYVGCGLGAELKKIRYEYPDANVIGIEGDVRLREIAQKTDVIFGSVEEFAAAIKSPVINLLIIDKRVQGKLKKSDIDLLGSRCMSGCILLSEEQTADYDCSKIKLVIWDLDDAFWKGTLSEGEVEYIPENIETVKLLTDAGIINSISSKNNYSEAVSKLENCGIADLFVFNDINWNNKGEQIVDKLSRMHLRSENVLFVDDDIRNLREAEHFAPGIMTALPSEIEELAEYAQRVAKTDLSHKRLEEYKILEKKDEAERHFENRDDFLFDSNINVSVFFDCIEEAERITELVGRTNQLNFTKNRESAEKLIYSFGNPNIKKGYVCAFDKYGDYGVVGFFCFEKGNRKLKHFLFSCRVMGMGIPECIYEYLGYPDVDVALPVAVDLTKRRSTPWIEMTVDRKPLRNSDGNKEDPLNRVKVLLKGPCDMGALQSYVQVGDISTEFNCVNESGFISAGYNHTVNIIEAATMDENIIRGMIEDVPFIRMEDYDTSMLETEYDVICFSLLQDYHSGLYRRKGTEFYINFGMADFDMTDRVNWPGYIDGSIENHMFPFTEDILEDFSQKWEFVGITPDELLINNLRYLCNNVKGNPIVMLTLGSEVPFSTSEEGFATARNHKRLNSLVREFSKERKNIRLLDPSVSIKSCEDYEDSINHYGRKVYFDMSTGIVNEICCQGNCARRERVVNDMACSAKGSIVGE